MPMGGVAFKEDSFVQNEKEPATLVDLNSEVDKMLSENTDDLKKTRDDFTKIRWEKRAEQLLKEAIEAGTDASLEAITAKLKAEYDDEVRNRNKTWQGK